MVRVALRVFASKLTRVGAGGGYLVSRWLVISDHEAQQVTQKGKPMELAQSELYATIRRSEDNLRKRREQ